MIFGCEMQVDYIAASFVRRAEDVLAIREIFAEQGNTHTQIIAKIENQEGVDNMDSILEVVDGIMVARGDLGVEVPAEDVPLIQKEIIAKCNAAGKIVITATQMLESMQKILVQLVQKYLTLLMQSSMELMQSCYQENLLLDNIH